MELILRLQKIYRQITGAGDKGFSFELVKDRCLTVFGHNWELRAPAFKDGHWP